MVPSGNDAQLCKHLPCQEKLVRARGERGSVRWGICLLSLAHRTCWEGYLLFGGRVGDGEGWYSHKRQGKQAGKERRGLDDR
jgi:hypothetical protein